MSGNAKPNAKVMNIFREELLKWLCIKHATNAAINRTIVRKSAMEIIRHLNMTGSFKCAESWLTVFLKRHGFSPVLDSDAGPTLEDWSTWVDLIRGLINQYSIADQFHLDELTMYTDFAPTEPPPTDASMLRVRLTTPPMQQMTMIVACNAAGDEKLKPLICGANSVQETGDFFYTQSPDVTVTDEVVAAWLQNLNRQMAAAGRSIVLFLSRKRVNVVKLANLTHILLVFYPLEMPPHVKPLRRDVFHFVKMHYRRAYVQRIVDVNNCRWTHQEIAEAVCTAWMEVPRDLIVFRFTKTRFRIDDTVLVLSSPEFDQLKLGASFATFVTFDDKLSDNQRVTGHDPRFLIKMKEQYNLLKPKAEKIVPETTDDENTTAEPSSAPGTSGEGVPGTSGSQNHPKTPEKDDLPTIVIKESPKDYEEGGETPGASPGNDFEQNPGDFQENSQNEGGEAPGDDFGGNSTENAPAGENSQTSAAGEQTGGSFEEKLEETTSGEGFSSDFHGNLTGLTSETDSADISGEKTSEMCSGTEFHGNLTDLTAGEPSGDENQQNLSDLTPGEDSERNFGEMTPETSETRPGDEIQQNLIISVPVEASEGNSGEKPPGECHLPDSTSEERCEANSEGFGENLVENNHFGSELSFSAPEKLPGEEFSQSSPILTPGAHFSTQFPQNLENSAAETHFDTELSQNLENSTPEQRFATDFPQNLENSAPEQRFATDFPQNLENSAPEQRFVTDFPQNLQNSTPGEEKTLPRHRSTPFPSRIPDFSLNTSETSENSSKIGMEIDPPPNRRLFSPSEASKCENSGLEDSNVTEDLENSSRNHSLVIDESEMALEEEKPGKSAADDEMEVVSSSQQSAEASGGPGKIEFGVKSGFFVRKQRRVHFDDENDAKSSSDFAGSPDEQKLSPEAVDGQVLEENCGKMEVKDDFAENRHQIEEFHENRHEINDFPENRHQIEEFHENHHQINDVPENRHQIDEYHENRHQIANFPENRHQIEEFHENRHQIANFPENHHQIDNFETTGVHFLEGYLQKDVGNDFHGENGGKNDFPVKNVENDGKIEKSVVVTTQEVLEAPIVEIPAAVVEICVQTSENAGENVKNENFPGETVENEGFPAKIEENGSFPGKIVENVIFPQENVENEGFPRENVENGSFPRENVENGSFSGKHVENEDFPGKNEENGSFPKENEENANFPGKTVENESFPEENAENGILVGKNDENACFSEENAENANVAGKTEENECFVVENPEKSEKSSITTTEIVVGDETDSDGLTDEDSLPEDSRPPIFQEADRFSFQSPINLEKIEDLGTTTSTPLPPAVFKRQREVINTTPSPGVNTPSFFPPQFKFSSEETAIFEERSAKIGEKLAKMMKIPGKIRKMSDSDDSDVELGKIVKKMKTDVSSDAGVPGTSKTIENSPTDGKIADSSTVDNENLEFEEKCANSYENAMKFVGLVHKTLSFSEENAENDDEAPGEWNSLKNQEKIDENDDFASGKSTKSSPEYPPPGETEVKIDFQAMIDENQATKGFFAVVEDLKSEKSAPEVEISSTSDFCPGNSQNEMKIDENQEKSIIPEIFSPKNEKSVKIAPENSSNVKNSTKIDENDEKTVVSSIFEQNREKSSILSPERLEKTLQTSTTEETTDFLQKIDETERKHLLPTIIVSKCEESPENSGKSSPAAIFSPKHLEVPAISPKFSKTSRNLPKIDKNQSVGGFSSIFDEKSDEKFSKSLPVSSGHSTDNLETIPVVISQETPENLQEIDEKSILYAKSTQNVVFQSKLSENTTFDSKSTENIIFQSKLSENTTFDAKSTENIIFQSKLSENTTFNATSTENVIFFSKSTQNVIFDSKSQSKPQLRLRHSSNIENPPKITEEELENEFSPIFDSEIEKTVQKSSKSLPEYKDNTKKHPDVEIVPNFPEKKAKSAPERLDDDEIQEIPHKPRVLSPIFGFDAEKPEKFSPETFTDSLEAQHLPDIGGSQAERVFSSIFAEKMENSGKFSSEVTRRPTTTPDSAVFARETAFQEASRELEEKLRDLEANDPDRRFPAAYDDDDNTSESAKTIETVCLLKELLSEAGSPEFRGFPDVNYGDEEQGYFRGVKRDREDDEEESQRKRVVREGNWAQRFENSPVFGPYGDNSDAHAQGDDQVPSCSYSE